MLCYKPIRCFLLFIFLLPVFFESSAQFKGGIGKGITTATMASAALGNSVYKGGNDDGFALFSTPAQSLGTSIYKGGSDDGVTTMILSSQTIGASIFKGSNDDGFTLFSTSTQSLGINIFKGNADDGFALGTAASQSLGRSIYYGGNNDGWAMAITSQAVPLPVTLTSFTARWDQQDVLATWVTANESNTDHFEIERSSDGSNFTFAGRTNAAGTSTVSTSYTFRDVAPNAHYPSPPPKLYYRLKTVDRDGRFEYSAIVVLSNLQGPAVYTLYPNPASRQFTIETPGLQNHYALKIISVTSQTVLQKEIAAGREVVDVSALANGTYFVVITDITTKATQTFKVLIQH